MKVFIILLTLASVSSPVFLHPHTTAAASQIDAASDSKMSTPEEEGKEIKSFLEAFGVAKCGIDKLFFNLKNSIIRKLDSDDMSKQNVPEKWLFISGELKKSAGMISQTIQKCLPKKQLAAAAADSSSGERNMKKSGSGSRRRGNRKNFMRCKHVCVRQCRKRQRMMASGSRGTDKAEHEETTTRIPSQTASGSNMSSGAEKDEAESKSVDGLTAETDSHMISGVVKGKHAAEDESVGGKLEKATMKTTEATATTTTAETTTTTPTTSTASTTTTTPTTTTASTTTTAPTTTTASTTTTTAPSTTTAEKDEKEGF